MDSIRVKVDREFWGRLSHGYHHSECRRLPELKNLSESKMLHIAAFIVGELAITLQEEEAWPSKERAAAVLDVIRQMAVVYEQHYEDLLREGPEIEIEGRSQP